MRIISAVDEDDDEWSSASKRAFKTLRVGLRSIVSMAHRLPRMG